MKCAEPILEVKDLEVNYGPIAAVKRVSFRVNRGQIVTLIGSNGAGKSTILRAISGLVGAKKGSITYEGKSVLGQPAYTIVRRGLCHCPEGRGVFPSLSVKENLEMGGYTASREQVTRNLDRAGTLFPRLKERWKQSAGTLSGGEQQMLAIARALMTDPKVLLLDEPSLGLAPQVVHGIFKIIREINSQGTAILLVEQNARMALQVAHEGHVLETGSLTLSGSGQTLLANTEVQKAYLGG